ncbi:vitamin B6 photo-protection and homoeostasis-domain-containing protein [Lipomyces japonicus]|uniref:vitamin B6 photo-protection and homoeostasis-domain-containing protein n=1 Tax=Lipomyces japonicus TaxID=56871 RepID=UPI0034CE5DF7
MSFIIEERDANGLFSHAYYDYAGSSSLENEINEKIHYQNAIPSASASSSSSPSSSPSSSMNSYFWKPSEIVQVSADGQKIDAITESVINHHHHHHHHYKPNFAAFSIGRQTMSSRVLRLMQVLIRVFLPTGYPDSVTNDYTDYQIYDSIQAFAFSINSLIANRAVLTAVGVGDKEATSTSAMYITVIQETLGRLATILFAWKFGAHLEKECKKYRFAADLVNNAAIVCDVMSPHFHVRPGFKLFFLCWSGMLRAICTVMANGSRAALTQHFTDSEKGSISDVSAKDASQETVISLMGILAGSMIVPYLKTDKQIWTALTFLISIHLLTNYKAVRSVVMETLNRHRTNIIFSELMDAISPGMMESDLLKQSIILPTMICSPRLVSQKESIMEPDGVLRWGATGPVMGWAKIGNLKSLLKILPSTITIDQLLSIFANGSAGYVLWYETYHVPRQQQQQQRRMNMVTVRIAIVDRGHDDNQTSDEDYYHDSKNQQRPLRGADDTREVRAWVHALYLARLVRSQHVEASVMKGAIERDNIVRALAMVNTIFGRQGQVATALRARNWDLAKGRSMIVTGPVPRLRVNVAAAAASAAAVATT